MELHKSNIAMCFVFSCLLLCSVQAQDLATESSEPSNPAESTDLPTEPGETSNAAESNDLTAAIVAAFRRRQELFRENSSVARYRGLSHDWTSVLDIATKDDKVAFNATFERNGNTVKQEAVFDGKDTLIRLSHGVRANSGNAMDGVDLEDYFTAFNGCRLPKSRIHPDKDRFPDYTVLELLENEKLNASESADAVELQGEGVTLVLDPARQFVITKASYAYPKDIFMDIESTGFMLAEENVWIATEFVGKWRAREDPFFEITVNNIAWTVPDSRFHFLVQDKENVEDFRPYDGKTTNSVLVYTAFADPERMKQARAEAISQSLAAAAVRARQSFSRIVILAINLAIVVLVICIVVVRRRRANA